MLRQNYLEIFSFDLFVMLKIFLPLHPLNEKDKWSVRLGVRTPDFHSGNTGSIPVRTTDLSKTRCKLNTYNGFFTFTCDFTYSFLRYIALPRT